MLIQKIVLENFMARGSTELELPEAGVTVITGHNGAGKSRFIEAVAYAYWGETLRDSDPWPEGLAGSVSVLSDVGDATRKITTKGTKSLSWNGQKADTNSRTQELIQSAVPEFSFWKRTHVFSSGEASNFSGATDGERKRIMEQLLGMDVFDGAQRICLDELGRANAEALRVAQLVAEWSSRLSVAEATLSSLSYADFRPGVPPAPPAGAPCTFSEADEAKRVELSDWLEQAERRGPVPPLPEAEARRTVQWELKALEDSRALALSGQCSKCKQPWHGSKPAYFDQEIKECKERLAALEKQEREKQQLALLDDKLRREKVSQVRSELQELATRLTQATLDATRRQDYAAELANFDAVEEAARAEWQAGKAKYDARVAQANADAQEARDELFDLQGTFAEAQRLAAELQATSAVLGVKGLRGHVLGRALEGVEHVANYWLQQIAPGRALSVRSEGDAGKIVLTLKGYGGGKYKAASSGERRRVDAPLLLALAEVAGAGRMKGTLFLDEVFDALDVEGRELVCRALGELGATQSVVVITHQEDLAVNIPSVQRIRVSDGVAHRI